MGEAIRWLFERCAFDLMAICLLKGVFFFNQEDVEKEQARTILCLYHPDEMHGNGDAEDARRIDTRCTFLIMPIGERC